MSEPAKSDGIAGKFGPWIVVYGIYLFLVHSPCTKVRKNPKKSHGLAQTLLIRTAPQLCQSFARGPLHLFRQGQRH
jgi:hypothetical protein